MKDPDKPELVRAPPEGELQSEPPVVARLVVEIRSDGSARRASAVRRRQRRTTRGAGRLMIQLTIAGTCVDASPRLGARSRLLGRKRDR
jgi:hypothetical protein